MAEQSKNTSYEIDRIAEAGGPAPLECLEASKAAVEPAQHEPTVGEDLAAEDDRRLEEQAARALEQLSRSYPDRLAPAPQPAPQNSVPSPPAPIQFRVPPAHFAAAVVAVRLPTSDAAILTPAKPGARSKRRRSLDDLHKCQLVVGSDRIRFVNTRKGLQCEYQLPLADSPIGVADAQIAFEVPVFHFEALFADSFSSGLAGKRRRIEWQSEAVTFTYDPARRTLNIEVETAHLQIPADACPVPPMLPAIPDDCVIHGRSVAKTLDRALSHAASFSSLNDGDNKILNVVSFRDGVVHGGAGAAVSKAESPLLKDLAFNLSRDVVADVRSVLRRLKAIQISTTADKWIFGDHGFTAAVSLVDCAFPKPRLFDHFLEAPQHWTMKMEDLLFAALALDCLQSREGDRNPTYVTLSISERGSSPHLNLDGVAPGATGESTVPVEAVEHGHSATAESSSAQPVANANDLAEDQVFKAEARIRLAYLVRALKLADGQQQVDLFMRQGMAMLRTRIDDLTVAHALSAAGRHRSR